MKCGLPWKRSWPGRMPSAWLRPCLSPLPLPRACACGRNACRRRGCARSRHGIPPHASAFKTRLGWRGDDRRSARCHVQHGRKPGSDGRSGGRLDRRISRRGERYAAHADGCSSPGRHCGGPSSGGGETRRGAGFRRAETRAGRSGFCPGGSEGNQQFAARARPGEAEVSQLYESGGNRNAARLVRDVYDGQHLQGCRSPRTADLENFGDLFSDVAFSDHERAVRKIRSDPQKQTRALGGRQTSGGLRECQGRGKVLPMALGEGR